MQIPLNINFDYTPNRTQFNGIIRLPKMYQGAPYDQTIKVKDLASGLYRDFSVYSEIRMQLRTTLNSPVLLSLSKSAGQIQGSAVGLRIVTAATDTDGVNMTGAAPQQGIVELPFVYDIELINGGVVVERFAQGTGFIVGNVTR